MLRTCERSAMRGIIRLLRNYQNRDAIITWIRIALIQSVKMASTTHTSILTTPFLCFIAYICRPLAFWLDYHANIHYHKLRGLSIVGKDYLASIFNLLSILKKVVYYADMS